MPERVTPRADRPRMPKEYSVPGKGGPRFALAWTSFPKDVTRFRF